MRLSGPTLDATDPLGLADFYAVLLGWEFAHRDGPQPGDPPEAGWAMLRAPDGSKLEFQWDPNFRAPVWPSVGGEQLMMMHLDIGVADLGIGVRWAQANGAVLAEHQPQEDVRVMFDPAGHPFCLFRDDSL
jgi:hypothetical protein